MITSRSGAPVGLTESGRALRSSAAREQVASKPMPRTASAGRADASIASRTADVTALQMLSDDCSTISPASRQTLSTPRRFGALRSGSEMVVAVRTVIQWNALDVWVKRRVVDTTFGTIYC